MLQYVAVCSSVLQCVVDVSVVQCVVDVSVVQCVAVWCSVVQCGAVCCSVLQYNIKTLALHVCECMFVCV